MNEMIGNKAYSYNDIVLTPSYSKIVSRRELDCSVDFCGVKFKSVAIPSNMKCAIDFNKAKELSESGYFYVLHRFYKYTSILEWLMLNQHLRCKSISVGVQEKDKELINLLLMNNVKVDFITIDVAHGHHILVKEMIEHIRSKLSNNVKIIAGNIGTKKAVRDLRDWGANAVKVGLSMGKSCTTYNCTGVGTPMFSTMIDCCSDCDFHQILF